MHSPNLGTKVTGLLIRPAYYAQNFAYYAFEQCSKNTHYAQYYAQQHCNYATDYIQFIIFNGSISIDRLQPVSCYVAALLYFTCFAQ